jgi:hypothetical protein
VNILPHRNTYILSDEIGQLMSGGQVVAAGIDMHAHVDVLYQAGEAGPEQLRKVASSSFTLKHLKLKEVPKKLRKLLCWAVVEIVQPPAGSHRRWMLAVQARRV